VLVFARIPKASTATSKRRDGKSDENHGKDSFVIVAASAAPPALSRRTSRGKVQGFSIQIRRRQMLTHRRWRKSSKLFADFSPRRD
jgi:hypothetical protein